MEDDCFNFHHLVLLRNGHIEFWTEVADDSFTGLQPEAQRKKHPLLFAHPVCEYPVSFLRLVKAIYKYVNQDSAVLVGMFYSNIKGCILRPGHPLSRKWIVGGNSGIAKPYALNGISIQQRIQKDFNPDEEGYKLVKELYSQFGYSEEDTPSWWDEKRNFILIPTVQDEKATS